MTGDGRTGRGASRGQKEKMVRVRAYHRKHVCCRSSFPATRELPKHKSRPSQRGLRAAGRRHNGYMSSTPGPVKSRRMRARPAARPLGSTRWKWPTQGVADRSHGSHTGRSQSCVTKHGHPVDRPALSVLCMTGEGEGREYKYSLHRH